MRWVSFILLLVSSSAIGSNVPGGVVVWDIPDGATGIRYQNRPVLIIGSKAIVGIPVFEKPGQHSLSFMLDGERKNHNFEVKEKKYTEQHITIKNKALVSPPQTQLDRIREESKRQRALYDSYSSVVHFKGGFEMPLEGTITSLFGHRRYFNGQPRSPHSGLDIAAKEGTPILAPASGEIVLADELYFNGKTVFIDHGQGLVTMYCHMSQILVANGKAVQQGHQIGLVGSTGRATGPHLHWSVSLNGFRVDPYILIENLNTIVGAGDVSYGG